MLKGRSLFIALLTTFAIWMAISVSASVAQPMLVGCAHVGSGRGYYSNSHCHGAPNGGSYALQYFLPPSTLLICALDNSHPEYSNTGCSRTSGTRKYARFYGPSGRTGETVKITGSNTYVFRTTVSKTKTLIKCSSMKASDPVIEGGEATKSSAESLQYSGCVVEEPTKCAVASSGKAEGTINTGAVTTELVENTSTTKVEQLIAPKTGSTFIEFAFKNKESEECALKGVTAKIVGSSLTSVSPEINEEKEEGEESEQALYVSEPTSKKYKNSEGTEKEAKLEVEKGEAVTLEGRAAEEEEDEPETVEDESTKETTKVEGGDDGLGFEK